jgi:hypothetical protein
VLIGPRLTFAVASLLLAGCIDGFSGSNVQFDFSPGTPVQASPGVAPVAGELASDIHFSLYAFDEHDSIGSLFEVQQFEIHRIVDLKSPCFIDVGAHVPHPGLHVSQYAAVIAADNGIPDYTNPPAGATEQQKIDVATAVARQAEVALLSSPMGMKAVTSASTAIYPALGADCSDTSGIPPPTCTDDDSNARRLAMCQDAWASDSNFWEGSDRVLTQPLHGTTAGMVDGMNPVNLAPVGGAQFYVDEVLSNFTGFAVYWQADGAAAGDPGTLLFFGTPTAPTRGVIHVHMTNPMNPLLTADLAIFADLAEDDTQF